MKKKSASKGVEREEAPRIPPAVFVQAGEAVKGKKYVGHTLNAVMTFTGLRRNRDSQGFHFGKTIPPNTDYKEYECRVQDVQGDDYRVYVPETTPVRDWPARVDDVLEEHLRKAAIYKERDHGVKAPKTRTVVENGVEREVPVAPKRAGPPRAGKDPRTDCVPGSDAHAIGTIMLDAKPGRDHRARCMPLIVEHLIKSGKEDCPKTRGLASSWYSTHYTKKPHIYGHLQGAK